MALNLVYTKFLMLGIFWYIKNVYIPSHTKMELESSNKVRRMALPKVKIEVEPDKIVKTEVIASYRITIPKDVRKDLGIEIGDTVIIAILGVEKSSKKKRRK